MAFIGGGNMATAIIGGLIRQGRDRTSIGVVEIDAAARERLQSTFGVATATAPESILAGADTVVLAVKPQQARDCATQLGPLIGRRLVVTIAAGIRIDSLSRWLGGTRRIVRVMPNTPALIGAGVSALFAGEDVDAGERGAVQAMFDAVGASLWLEREEDMDAVTAVSGSGPAYVFYFMEAMLDAAGRLGLSPEAARLLTLQTFAGAARLASESTEQPATLRVRVTSPGGTTEAALRSMEASTVKAHVVAVIEAAAARSRELGDLVARS